jgi:hypothetical protein
LPHPLSTLNHLKKQFLSVKLKLEIQDSAQNCLSLFYKQQKKGKYLFKKRKKNRSKMKNLIKAEF